MVELDHGGSTDTALILHACPAPHPEVDEPQSLLQRLLTGVLVVGVGLLVELRHVFHHLNPETTGRELSGETHTTESEKKNVCVLLSRTTL